MKTIPLSSLEADPNGMLTECADRGEQLVVELPDHRLISIQSLEPSDDDPLVDELLSSNAAFRALIGRSRSAPRKPFSPRS